MGFFDFESAVAESAPSGARPPASRRPSPPATSRPAARPTGPTTPTRPASPTRPAPPAGRQPSGPPPQPAAREPGPNFIDRIGRGASQAADLGRIGLNIAQLFRRGGGAAPAPAPNTVADPPYPPPPAGAPAPVTATPADPSDTPADPATTTATPPPQAPATAPAPAAQQVALLLRALQQRQIPPLPGTPVPLVPGAPAGPPRAPAADGLALLRLILGNPQFQQAMWAGGPTGPPAPVVTLPMPPPRGAQRPRRTEIPIGAVLNAVALLAGQSLRELTEQTEEDAPDVPEYLVGEDGEFVVDPADPARRASLVTHLFRVSDATRRRRPEAVPRASPPSSMTDADAWARDAGFPM
jgi:hypothetical protein